MYNAYFKIALRNLLKQKGLASINILGLSIGIACFSLFFLYAINEHNYDRFHVNAENIYQVYQWSRSSDNPDGQAGAYLPMPLGPAIKQDIPGVKEFVRIKEAWDKTFVKIGQDFYQVPVSFADPSFFDVFSFELKSRSGGPVLDDLHNVVLSERTAKQLFGDTDPVGKTIAIKVQDEYEPFMVSAVAEKAPSNSSISFDILASFEYFATTRNGSRSVDNWARPASLTYLQFDSGSAVVGAKTLQEFYTKYHPNEAEALRQQGRWNGSGEPITYRLQPLLEMHTGPRINGGRIGSIDSKNIRILMGIASGILLIACINFMSLAIGRSVGRAKEVGIRKVIGSGRKSLIIQFVSDALLLSVISTCIGLLLGRLLLPYFNRLSGRDLAFSFEQFPELALFILLLPVVIGLLAGSYPALVLSGFNPLDVLKQRIKLGGSVFITKSLVTFQFVLSIGLIASTSIIIQQIDYMTGTSPGFKKDYILVVNGDDVDAKKIYPLFKQAALQQSQVNGVAGAGLAFGEGTGWMRHAFQFEGEHKEVFTYFVDNDFIPLMNIQLLAGRNFDPAISSDTETAVIVNEAMVRDFGWTIENALGQELRGYYENDDAKSPVVIGVVKNFHFRPLKEEVKPQLFHQFSGNLPNKYFVSTTQSNPSDLLAALEAEWKQLVPELPFRYSFLDEDLERFYTEEKRWGNVIGWAGGISIFLACLGLFGLVVLATNKKTKEIGIRKILGASAGSIIGLLSKDFLMLVLIAFLIAAPLASYFVNLWLQTFAYRINIDFLVLVGSGAIALLIAVLTISYHVVKAALINPVNNLRTE